MEVRPPYIGVLVPRNRRVGVLGSLPRYVASEREQLWKHDVAGGPCRVADCGADGDGDGRGIGCGFVVDKGQTREPRTKTKHKARDDFAEDGSDDTR